MPGRTIGTRLAAWIASLAILGCVAAISAPTAIADTPPPPPWVNGQLPVGTWVGFTLSSTNPPEVSRNPSPKWGPVTLTRIGTAPTTALEADSGGWPNSWSSNGITLVRADQFCPIAQTFCRYYITSGAGQPFFFGASGGSNPPGGPDPAQYVNQGPLDLKPAMLQAQLIPPTGGALPSGGTFTFNASAHDDIPGNLNYHWTLTPQSGSVFTQDGPSPTFTPPPSIFNQNGQYCVTVVVTANDGTTPTPQPPQACFAVTISNTTPTPPQNPAPPQTPGPPASPGPTPQPPAVSPAPAAPLSFAKPLPNFAVPVAGAVQQVTVIWLWKPDWFQSTAAGRAVRTGGRPKAVKRASVSVAQNANRSTPSAAPWLAGLGAFGIFGAGWLAFRRRSLRSSLLD